MAKLNVDENGVILAFSKIKPHDSVGLDVSAKIIQNYDFAYDTDTRDLKIVETDKEDREAYIQSFAAETGVYNIMRMYAKTGDLSLLNRRQGFYGDISGLPEDELNPGAHTAAAIQSVKGLSKMLGEDLTVDQLASMSVDEINSLLEKVVAAKASKVVDKKDGE